MRSAEREEIRRTVKADGACFEGKTHSACTQTQDDWQHEGLAVACARRFLNRGVLMEELLQEARTAICVAQTRFCPERGLCFSTYAVPVVLGALRECCRRASLVRGKRAGKQTAPAVCHLTSDPDTLHKCRQESFEERLLLRDAVRRLGSPYGQVIGLRYLCGLSQRETGERLGAAQWQISRWEQAGLALLRERWGQ